MYEVRKREGNKILYFSRRFRTKATAQRNINMVKRQLRNHAIMEGRKASSMNKFLKGYRIVKVKTRRKK